MNGTQETIYNALIELAQSVKDGKYGRGDDIDTGALDADISDMLE